jgi:hypothetical protein
MLLRVWSSRMLLLQCRCAELEAANSAGEQGLLSS